VDNVDISVARVRVPNRQHAKEDRFKGEQTDWRQVEISRMPSSTTWLLWSPAMSRRKIGSPKVARCLHMALSRHDAPGDL